MPEELTVHVNRSRRHAIEVADGPFVTAGSFEVVLVNHGDGAHVHLSLDGDLAAAGSVASPAPFLDADATQRVAVDVAAAGPFGGALTLSAGYGQSSIEVPVRIDPDAGPTVDPSPDASKPSSGLLPALADRLPALDGVDATDPGTIGLLALAGGALVLAVLVASMVDSAVVMLGVVVVVAAVGGALAFLLRG
ncbi:hypothetical protein SAMN06269185_0829 [Natronoarchaeum philippinense]|uniref:Uncharacterized protein n=1 Tax=Natronoarchaeum philippinense TaxID=558529 RepID=A0A285N7N0_NATPI|nr:hypothetical protein [Natronoarchaeum philippinense]SNZ05328.1 hypothetical protein SAMN06269185_0829 [Natronoarchaeum philippinense]